MVSLATIALSNFMFTICVDGLHLAKRVLKTKVEAPSDLPDQTQKFFDYMKLAIYDNTHKIFNLNQSACDQTAQAVMDIFETSKFAQDQEHHSNELLKSFRLGISGSIYETVRVPEWQIEATTFDSMKEYINSLQYKSPRVMKIKVGSSMDEYSEIFWDDHTFSVLLYGGKALTVQSNGFGLYNTDANGTHVAGAYFYNVFEWLSDLNDASEPVTQAFDEARYQKEKREPRRITKNMEHEDHALGFEPMREKYGGKQLLDVEEVILNSAKDFVEFVVAMCRPMRMPEHLTGSRISIEVQFESDELQKKKVGLARPKMSLPWKVQVSDDARQGQGEAQGEAVSVKELFLDPPSPNFWDGKCVQVTTIDGNVCSGKIFQVKEKGMFPFVIIFINPIAVTRTPPFTPKRDIESIGQDNISEVVIKQDDANCVYSGLQPIA